MLILKRILTIENTVTLKTNTIDTNDDNNLVFNRNNVEYFRLTTVESVDSVDFVNYYEQMLKYKLIIYKLINFQVVFNTLILDWKMLIV